MKPFSQACENNKNPILNVLSKVFTQENNIGSVLEIGSGTGQHAIYFGERMPHLQWHTSDLLENHPGIDMWLDEHPSQNIFKPEYLDVTLEKWPESILNVNALYSANTLHIMPWSAVIAMFDGIKNLTELKTIAIYGPFKYNGEFTSESNHTFDEWLKDRAIHQGIRDFEKVNALAENADFVLTKDNKMPANNQLIIWEKK